MLLKKEIQKLLSIGKFFNTGISPSRSKKFYVVLGAIVLSCLLIYYFVGQYLEANNSVSSAKTKLLEAYREIGSAGGDAYIFAKYYVKGSYPVEFDAAWQELIRQYQKLSFDSIWKEEDVLAMDKSAENYMKIIDQIIEKLNVHAFVVGEEEFIAFKYNYQGAQAKLYAVIDKYNEIADEVNLKLSIFPYSAFSFLSGSKKSALVPVNILY